MAWPPDKHKEMGALELADFRDHAIWGGYEDDYGGSWVAPIASLETVDEEEFDMYFVYCELRLADKTQLEGVVYINTSNRSAYTIEFHRGEDEFRFPTIMFRDRNKAIEHLTRWLGKDLSQISPLTFSTPFHWRDGAAVAGSIDLVEWGVFF